MDAAEKTVCPEVEMRFKNVFLSGEPQCAVLIPSQPFELINSPAKSRNLFIFQFVLMKVQLLSIQHKCLFSSEGLTETSR